MSATVTILRDDLEAVIGFLEGFDFDDDPNAELVREYLPRLRSATDAHDELKAIHDVIMCIGCVTEAPTSDTYTLRGVKQMAVRINTLEAKVLALANRLEAMIMNRENPYDNALYYCVGQLRRAISNGAASNEGGADVQ